MSGKKNESKDKNKNRLQETNMFDDRKKEGDLQLVQHKAKSTFSRDLQFSLS